MVDNWQEFILRAVCNRNAAELEKIIKTANNQSLDFWHTFNSPLITAIKKWDYVITEKLLRAGASANFLNEFGIARHSWKPLRMEM